MYRNFRQQQGCLCPGGGYDGPAHLGEGFPDGALAVQVPPELRIVPHQVVDRVVHGDTDDDGGDGDGHHIQGDIHPAHDAQHAAEELLE